MRVPILDNAFILPHLARIDRPVGSTVVGEQKMMLRSAFSLTVLGILCGAAQAQPYPPPYPPANVQAYPSYRAPAPTMADDDDDDLPPNLRAAPGNYPPPPGGYQFPEQRANVPGGIQREVLPAPG